MNDFILFIRGSYRKSDIPFYRALCHSKCTIAVDGGYDYFRKAGLFPDIMLGDFDSLKRFPRNLPTTTTVLKYPSRKNKTDLHLAVEYCLSEKARTIDIIQPNVGEIDHFLGNIFLLAHSNLISDSKIQNNIRIINPKYEIKLVVDNTVTFLDCVGDIVSILPLSPKIVLDVTGAEYKVKNANLALGETRSLRNHITDHKATFHIHGKALIIRNFRRRYSSHSYE